MNTKVFILIFGITLLLIIGCGTILSFAIKNNTVKVNPTLQTTPTLQNTPTLLNTPTINNPILSSCGVTTCHGLEITCGNAQQVMCTQMYQTGDICLQYAKCALVNGSCEQIPNTKFNNCKNCVQKCIDTYSNSNDYSKLSECEGFCN